MTKFEYKIEYRIDLDFLNEMGREGWELVQLLSATKGTLTKRSLWKRQLMSVFEADGKETLYTVEEYAEFVKTANWGSVRCCNHL